MIWANQNISIQICSLFFFFFNNCLLFVCQEEVPPNVYYAHYKNVEKSIVNGKFDPTAGLASSGIAGTAPEKEDEENKNANADEEMRDVSKKDGGKLMLRYCIYFSIAFSRIFEVLTLLSHAVVGLFFRNWIISVLEWLLVKTYCLSFLFISFRIQIDFFINCLWFGAS